MSRRDLLRSASVAAGASLLASNTKTRAETAPPSPPSPMPMPNPADLLDLPDFERAAQSVMSPMAWAYVTGAAADELTLRWNHEAYEKIRLKPRALVDV